MNRPSPDPALGSVAPRVGKEIAHLTYGRLAYKTDEERQWTFTAITKAVVDVINIWLTRAPDYVRRELLAYLQDYSTQPEVSQSQTGN